MRTVNGGEKWDLIMARIPTPALRGQAIGSVQSQFTPTPFQNLKPDADVFGAAQARTLGQLAKGADALSTALIKDVEEDDTRDLTKFETDVRSHQLRETARINSLAGQAQQDAAATASTEFNAFVEGARAKYNFQLPSSNDAADNFSTMSQSRFSATSVAAFTAGKSTVTKQVVAARIGTAIQTLVANATPEGAEAFRSASKSTVLNLEAEAAGIDPALINYNGDDPAKKDKRLILEHMIRAYEGKGVSQAISRLLADGKAAEAIAFLADNPDFGKDTADRTAAEARVAPLQGRVDARIQLTGIVRTLGENPSLSAVRSAVYAAYPNDPQKQQDLNQEFTAYAGNRSQARNDLVNAQAVAYVNMILNGKNPMSRENAAKLPDFYAQNPRLLLPANVQKVAEGQAVATADKKWVEVEKGAAVSFDGIERALDGLAASHPAQFVAAMKSGKFKQFLDRADYNDLELIQDRVEKSLETLAGKNPVTVGSVLNRIGVPSNQRSSLNKHMQTMKAAIKSVQLRAAEQGKAADMEDIEKAVSGVLIRVAITDNFMMADKYSVRGALAVAETEPDFDEYTAELQPGRKNRRFLAVVFGKTEQVIKQAFDDMDGPINLTTLAKKLGVDTLPDARAELQKQETAYKDAADAGVPASLLDFLIKQSRTLNPKISYNPPDVAAVLGWYASMSTKTKADFLKAWGKQ
jgi:hypothetical protein